MTGYSSTPLVKKFGIKPGMRVRFASAPDHYEDLLGELPEYVTVLRSLRGPIDFIHFFTARETELKKRLPTLKKALAKDGMLWLSWPKKASSLPKDIDESAVRRLRLASGLVDIKICAVDEDWSGLKFVYRKADRA